MKNRNIVLLALAIGCGLVAAFLTAKLGASNKTEMVPVLVAHRERSHRGEHLPARQRYSAYRCDWRGAKSI